MVQSPRSIDMRTKPILITALLAITCFNLAVADNAKHSKYSGQETRAIKSLSQEDIVELERGGGWGMALVAELNGIPGPVHLLELKNEIGLTNDQLNEIQTLHDEMKKQAIEAGNQLIALERELEERFQSKLPTDSELKTMLHEIGKTRAQLRFIHLSTHLKTPHILSRQQIQTYNKMRGYSSADPCDNIPDGHDATMWRKHNQCK